MKRYFYFYSFSGDQIQMQNKSKFLFVTYERSSNLLWHRSVATGFERETNTLIKLSDYILAQCVDSYKSEFSSLHAVKGRALLLGNGQFVA